MHVHDWNSHICDWLAERMARGSQRRVQEESRPLCEEKPRNGIRLDAPSLFSAYQFPSPYLEVKDSLRIYFSIDFKTHDKLVSI